jgi:hypothetical protein
MRSPVRLAWCAVPFTVAALGLPREASSDDTIKRPDDHPDYSVDLEPHLLWGWAAQYPGDAFGLGARISIPLMQNGFIPTINNSVAISFGIDWLNYSDCYLNGAEYGGCSREQHLRDGRRGESCSILMSAAARVHLRDLHRRLCRQGLEGACRWRDHEAIRLRHRCDGKLKKGAPYA